MSICVTTSDADDLEAACQLAKEVKACFGWDWQIVQSNAGDVVIGAEKYAADDPRLYIEQGYRLRIGGRSIVIEAPSPTGRFYAVQTVRQLLRAAAAEAAGEAKGKAPSIPALSIRDWPAMEWRGISDDVSPGQVANVEAFRAIIRDLAYYKKNLYQPYIEDMFAFDTDPNIGATRGAITKAEMAILVEEARRNHITLCPVFECLGHQDRMLSLPENRRYAEVQDPEREPWSFSPVLPEAFQFVTSLIDEMAAATPDSPFFHIGGDESWDVGEGTSKERVAQVGKGQVHAEFFMRLAEHIQKTHKRRTLLYSDMLLQHPDALKIMPKDLIIVDWHYMPAADYPSVRKLKEAGYKDIFVSPGIWSWANFFPSYNIAFDNVTSFTMVGKREGAIGSIASSWGDDGAENLRENNWLGYALSAAVEWEPGAPGTVDSFLRRFVGAHYGVDSPALAAVLRDVGWHEMIDSRYPARLFHRTARMRKAEAPWVASMQKLTAAMKDAKQAIAAERPRVRANADQIDALDHAVRRYAFYADRELALDKMARMLEAAGSKGLDADGRAEIMRESTRLRDELVGITHEFESLWMRHRKYPRLEFNLARLQGQVAAYQNFIDRSLANELRRSPDPWGAWFWYPDPKQTTPTDPTELGDVYFVRAYSLDALPTAARVKCWADDRARVYVNGQKVLTAAYGDDPREASVAHLLKKGENIIAVEGHNDVGAAGIILEMTLRMPDGSERRLTADGDWRCTMAKVPKDWATTAPSGEGWTTPRIYGHGMIKAWDFIDW